MKESNLIPIFRHKELNPEYLDAVEPYEDDASNRIRNLKEVIETCDVRLDLNQLVCLNIFAEKSDYYANHLMCILADEDLSYYTVEEMEDFKNDFKPRTMSQKLIFKIFSDALYDAKLAYDIFEKHECEL